MKPITDLIGDTQLRALSWKEPFASLMLHGKIETRTWPTSYIGWVLICASQAAYSKLSIRQICGDQTIRVNAIFGFDDLYNGEAGGYYKGHAFAVGWLAGCRLMEKTDENACFVKYNPHLYCHCYHNVQKIEPFQWKGSQRWTIVKPEMIQKIQLL